jgi:curved DNA-binding protein CbpA
MFSGLIDRVGSADLFGPSDVPRMVPLPDYSGIDLTSEEGYLLSRIDGRINVASLLTVVNWDKPKTMALLESLLRKHVVNFDRKEIRDTAFGPGEETFTSPDAPVRVAPGQTPPIDPASIEAVKDLDPKRCMEILVWERSIVDAPSLYALFGLPDGADPKSVKREYRKMALSYHPDLFFRKEIGGYRLRIQTSWKRVQEAYEALTEPEQRKKYDAELAARPRPAAAPAPTAMPAPRGDTGSYRSVPGASPAPRVSAVPAAPAAGVASEPPRPRMESALERKLKAEVADRIAKARRHFEQAQADLKEKKWSAADSNIKLAMQFDPRNEGYGKWLESVKPQIEEGVVGVMLQKAEMAAASGNGNAVMEPLEHAVRLFPENVDANRALGLAVIEKMGDYKKAKDSLQKVVNKRPKDVPALVGLAKAMRALGMVKNALRVIEQAKALAPKDAKVLQELKDLKRSM